MRTTETASAPEIEYLGGHPKWDKPRSVYIVIKESQIKLIPSGFWSAGDAPLIISKDVIINVDFEKSSSRSAGKAVAGAIVGGVLTGGIGLLVGGALGARAKNKSELYIYFKYNDREFNLVLKTGKNTEKIYSQINAMFA